MTKGKLSVVLSVLFIATLTASTYAQTSGTFYKQFCYNPYIFNPAYAGEQGQQLHLAYRKQFANFTDSPVTGGMSYQQQVSDRLAFGLNFVSDKQILYKNTSLKGTFGYTIPLAAKQSLRFGISAGVGLNALDLTAEELAINDPAITKTAGNNYYIDGNFGFIYTNAGLKVGVAFTDVFKTNDVTPETFNRFSFSNLKNRLYSLSFRFNLDPFAKVSLEPYVLYKQTADGLQNYWEAASLVYFKEKLWTGVGYKQHSGITLFLGMNVTDKFSFSYSYDFPPFKAATSAMSSHELHLGFKFQKRNLKEELEYR